MPAVKEEQADADNDDFEPEDDQEESFFEAEMFHMNRECE